MIQSELIDRISDDIRQVKNVNDLTLLAHELKEQRKYLSKKIGNVLQRGDKVRVSNGRTIDYGEVIKVNRTRAVVRIDDQQWNVPFSMITKE
tara:strand:+ start:451 stop:726 length:276 start_codon:yes stop_codon:yes gene_type:complete